MKRILADTSIWIDHFRSNDAHLRELLRQERVLMHPFVLGELMMGSLADRTKVILGMGKLRQIATISDADVRDMVEMDKLFALGIGYVDAHLLASVRRTPSSTLWTRDRRLAKIASAFGILATPEAE